MLYVFLKRCYFQTNYSIPLIIERTQNILPKNKARKQTTFNRIYLYSIKSLRYKENDFSPHTIIQGYSK